MRPAAGAARRGRPRGGLRFLGLAALLGLLPGEHVEALPQFADGWITVSGEVRVGGVGIDDSVDPPRVLTIADDGAVHALDRTQAYEGRGIFLGWIFEGDVSSRAIEGLVDYVDRTGDGVPDLACRSFGSVSVAPGRAGGGFEELRVFGWPSSTPPEFHDMDGDDLPDLVGAGVRREALWRRSLGHGFFDGVDTLDSADRTGVAFGDIDGDGAVDLVSWNSHPPAIDLRRNDGRGGLGVPVSVVIPITAGGRLGQLVVGRLRGADRDDLLALVREPAIESGFEFRYVRGALSNAGGFEWESGPNLGTGPSVSITRLQDVDGDGRDDLVSANGYFPMGDTGLPGTFVPVGDRLGDTIRSSVMADLDDDDRQDLVQVTSSGLQIWLSSLQEGLPPIRSFPTPGWGSTPALIDLDGDGIKDLVGTSRYRYPDEVIIIPSSGADTLVVLPGLPDGGFGPARLFPEILLPEHLYAAPRPARLGSAGLTDLLFAAGDTLFMVEQTAPGAFVPHRLFVPDLGFDLEEVLPADLDGDGVDELLRRERDFSESVLLLHRDPLAPGGGSVDTFHVPGYLYDLVALELTGDEWLDLCLTYATSRGQRLELWQGWRGDSFPTRISVGRGFARKLTAGDWDGDGTRAPYWFDTHGGDLVTFNGFDLTLTPLPPPALPSAVFVEGLEVQALDVTGDGREDLVFDDVSESVGSVLPSEPGGGFGARFAIPQRGPNRLVEFEDRTGDGVPDRIQLGRYDGQVQVIPGLFRPPLASVRLQADTDGWSVELEWSGVPVGPAADLVLERRGTGAAAWSRVAAIPSGAAGRFVDPGITVQGQHVYRLARRYPGGYLETLATTTVTVAPDPARPRLLAPSPNPARAPVDFAYELTRPGPLVLEVFDAAGRLVRRLDAGLRPAERATLTWDLRADTGDRVASGLYFARIAGGGAARRVVVLR